MYGPSNVSFEHDADGWVVSVAPVPSKWVFLSFFCIQRYQILFKLYQLPSITQLLYWSATNKDSSHLKRMCSDTGSRTQACWVRTSYHNR